MAILESVINRIVCLRNNERTGVINAVTQFKNVNCHRVPLVLTVNELGFSAR